MKSLNLQSFNVVEISYNEQDDINGGMIIELILAAGAVAGACLAVYEAGKAVGETVYYLTH